MIHIFAKWARRQPLSGVSQSVFYCYLIDCDPITIISRPCVFHHSEFCEPSQPQHFLSCLPSSSKSRPRTQWIGWINILLFAEGVIPKTTTATARVWSQFNTTIRTPCHHIFPSASLPLPHDRHDSSPALPPPPVDTVHHDGIIS